MLFARCTIRSNYSYYHNKYTMIAEIVRFHSLYLLSMDSYSHVYDKRDIINKKILYLYRNIKSIQQMLYDDN